jgi:cytoskeletal protein RodZ
MVESIGAYLRRERELRKITLEEVSEHTHIKMEYLRAIESGHFEKIPGLTFARGYLKTYAGYIGLIPDEVLLRFEDLLKNFSKSTPIPTPKLSHRLFWLGAFVFLMAAAAVIILWLKK